VARTIHWALVITLVVMPVSVVVSTYAGGSDITVFGWQIIPNVTNHAVVSFSAIHKLKVIPRNEALHDCL